MLVLDTNIVMELVEERLRAKTVLRALNLYGNEPLYITTLTVSTAFYLAEAHKFDVLEVERVVTRCSVIDVDAADVDWALAHYKGKDFEDALQIAAALRQKCTVFMTLDAALAKKYGKFLTIELIR